MKRGGGVSAAWVEAYEIGFDQKSRNEFKQNLLVVEKPTDGKNNCKSNSNQFDAYLDQSTSSLGTTRGKMVHTTLK